MKSVSWTNLNIYHCIVFDNYGRAVFMLYFLRLFRISFLIILSRLCLRMAEQDAFQAALAQARAKAAKFRDEGKLPPEDRTVQNAGKWKTFYWGSSCVPFDN